MTPATLAALARGDFNNAFIAATPGGIERQEKQGQIEQSFRETLPIDGTLKGRHGKGGTRATWEAFGFVFGEPADDIFVNVKFPEGWKKSCTDHSMWSDLLDDKGRRRAAIFYKAAFYDRSAHVHFVTRYTVDAYADSETKDHYDCVVKDGTTVIERFGSSPQSGSYDERDVLRAKADKWLKDHYPNHADPAAYWNA